MFQCPVLPELLAMSEDSAQLNSLLKDANLPDHQEVKSYVKDSRDGQPAGGLILRMMRISRKIVMTRLVEI